MLTPRFFSHSVPWGGLARGLMRCKLCWRIALGVFVSILVIESVLLVPSALRFQRVELERIGSQVQRDVDLVLSRTRSARGVAGPVLNDLVGRHGILGVAVHDQADRFVVASGEGPALTPTGAFAAGSVQVIHTDPQGRFRDFAWRRADPRTAQAFARVDTSDLRAEVAGYVLRIAGLVAIIVLVVTVATMLVIYFTVLRTLLRLRRGALAASENPDDAARHHVPTRRSDELGDLVQAFNALLDRVTQSKARDRLVAEERAHFVTHHDALTGLPNRTALLERLENCVTQGETAQGVALYLINIVGLGLINAAHGTGAGDAMLRAIARRAREAAEAADFVSHLGGDRFALFRLGGIGAELDARFAEQLLAHLEAPLELESGEPLIPAVRIGIANAESDDLDGQTLLNQAEFALSRTRGEGAPHYEFYWPALAAQATERQVLTRELEQAIERDELFVVLQPKMALIAGGKTALSGAEALVRWRHPTRGMVSPAEFVPLAESTGLIVPIGERVLQLVCAQMRDWRARFGWSPRIAVNLSARQFALPDLVERIDRSLAAAQLSGEALELEVTESAAMNDVEITARALQGLRSLGVRVSIDDFGTGYSSLSYLRRFAFDAIKIDKSFVDEIGEDRNAEAICDAVLRLCRSLGTKSIAEGVETKRQLGFLRQRRCDEIQGYLFSKPLPVAEFEAAWMQQRAA